MGCSSSKELIKLKTEKESVEKDIVEPEEVGTIKNL
jgi:hypothetical protein